MLNKIILTGKTISFVIQYNPQTTLLAEGMKIYARFSEVMMEKTGWDLEGLIKHYLETIDDI